MLDNLEECLQKDVVERFKSESLAIRSYEDSIVIELFKADLLVGLLEYIQNNKDYQFKVLIDLFIVDYPSKVERFEVNYSLLSIYNNKRLYIKLNLAQEQSAPSVVHIFKSAGWLEREMWDMYGVNFKGNPDLRRILTDYGFEGHPLRKDFPLTGYKEIRYDDAQQKVVYEDVKLDQEYRKFDFESPWYGPNNDK